MRVKSIRGGRDGGKSWGVARALLEIGTQSEEFVVCARETMNSISDSVHRLLVNQITMLGFEDRYKVEKARIWHRGWPHTEFVFKGLRHNPEGIKSLEGATKLWVEEAQSVSDDSWQKIIPTLRRPNSEIWLTWNPKLETDATWTRFVVDPPPDIVNIQMNFADNPWASEVLRREREKMQRDKPDEYAHVWLGQPLRQLEGAIYASELRLAESQGRIGKVPYDPEIPVYTAWDLGDSDIMAIWFIQPVMGQYRVIDYMEDRHKPMSHFLTALEAKGYRYALDFFPWDAASKVLIGSLEESMRARGRNVRVLDRMSREVGIDAVREMLGTCWFDMVNCADGLQRLRYYRYGETKVLGADGRAVQTREPVHDDNSHGADALRSAAMGFRRKMEKPKPAAKPVVTPRRYVPPPTAWS
jgi:phage terminase large subunit